MSYTQLLRDSAKKFNSIVCLGLDPELSKIPIEGAEANPRKAIMTFFTTLLDAMESEGVMPGAVKPNYAFFSQYGIAGLQALKAVIDHAKSKGLPVILDAKRGDIGNTSVAYAKEAFDAFQADALTVAPYMGSDSVEPFITYGQGKGFYILNRTSNKGAVDFQNLKVENSEGTGKTGKIPLWKAVSHKIIEWHQPGTGAVIGATFPKELEQISQLFVDSGKEIPLLIPGVGAQGGSAKEIVAALRKTGNDLSIHRINSSRGIIYAYQEEKNSRNDADNISASNINDRNHENRKNKDYAGAAVRALKKLNEEIAFS